MRPRNPTVRFALFGRGTDAPTAPAQTKPAGHRVRSGSTFRRCAGPRHSPPTALPDRPPAAGKRRAACRRTTGSCRRRECALPPAPRRSARLCGQGSISERLLVTTSNLFPTNPTAKASVAPKTDAHPHANVPQKPKGNGPAIRLPSNDVLRRLPLLRNHPPEYIFTGQLSDKQERKTSEGGQNRHRNTPPTLPRTELRFPETVFREAETCSYKEQKRQQNKKTCESQHTEPRFPKRIFASCRSRSSRVKREFRIRPPSCPQCCDCTQNGKGKPALRRTVVRRSPPPFSARFHPRSPAFACSPALSPEKRNDAGSEVGNDAPHGRKTSVTLLPAPHSPFTSFPHSVPGFPVLTAALARMPTRQVYTPMDRGLCLPSSSPTAGSPGSKPCKHPDRRPPPPRRGIGAAIPESAARRVFRRHVRTCRRNRPRPGPKPSPGNGPPRKMRK